MSKRSLSSTRWLARQARDPYVARARSGGYRSRAAFKLMEIDDRFKLLRQGARVLDLGAAPGGWTQVAVARTGSLGGDPRVLALDIAVMQAIAGARIEQVDLLAEDAAARIAEMIGPMDVVLSDMAPAMSGHRETDHLRAMNLVETALSLAIAVLKPGGAFVAKVLQGGGERALIDAAKRHFAQVRRVKPPASRDESAEFYLVATGFTP
jgi:23S rRNA (uridine2552-2'-O)-methyltransferase